MKVLFLMDSPEYMRFYDSAIEELAARGHDVAIAVNNQRAKKPVGLEGLKTYGDRVSVLGVAPSRTGMWREVARGLRGVMDFARFLHPAYVAAPALRARIKRKVLPRTYAWLDRIRHVRPSTVRRLQRGLMAADHAMPPCRPIVEFLAAQSPDVLLVSPLVAAASEQVDWVTTAGAAGIRTAVCIASWDNLTNKGLLRVEPDRVIVWNEAQKREATEYHYVRPETVAVTGAQLFDKWFEKRATLDRAAFCARVGLRDTSPFLLFTGSSSFISESSAEVAFVRRWIDALRASADPTLRDIQILVRPHPYNVHRWADGPVTDVAGVSVFPRSGYNPVDRQNRDDFFDSLWHCAAVVGVNTSAMIEAAIVGRPVCSLLAPEFSGTQEGTIHFRHLLPENGGFLRLASTIDEHVQQLSECLRHPDAVAAQTRGFVASFIRPHGLERRATDIFADAVERLGHAPAPEPVPPSSWRVLLRPLLLIAALPVLIDNRVSDPGAVSKARKRAGAALGNLRKRIAKRWKRFEQAW